MTSESPHLKIAIGVAIGIVVLQAVVGFALYLILPDWPARGQFGDAFGSINATFSGLAFAGLIYAILLQREDLALQRSELELTRQELTRAATAQEQSEIALRRQAQATLASARLSATTFLLGEYTKEVNASQQKAFTVGDPMQARMDELLRRVAVLTEVLDSEYEVISGEVRLST